MELFNDYENFKIYAFWSKKVSDLINEINSVHGKSYATQHDITLKFINDNIFQGEGEFNREFREQGKTYPDLKIFLKAPEKRFEVVELRIHTSELKYLRRELNKREKTFSKSDHLYFSYFLQLSLKEKGKVLKTKTCIYYLVIIILSSKTRLIPINDLVDDIKLGAEDFTKKLKKESGIDDNKEELLGVENMLKVVDLERKVSVLEAELDEKDRELDVKDKEIDRLKAQLRNE